MVSHRRCDGLTHRGEIMAKDDNAGREAEAALSGQLKAMFDAISGQPVPEKLLELVDALEEKRRDREQTDDGEP